MRWLSAERSEVARRIDETDAKMPCPQAIDGDAGGERIVGVSDPLREFESSTRAFRKGWTSE